MVLVYRWLDIGEGFHRTLASCLKRLAFSAAMECMVGTVREGNHPEKGIYWNPRMLGFNPSSNWLESDYCTP
jgi:hypothetical protein